MDPGTFCMSSKCSTIELQSLPNSIVTASVTRFRAETSAKVLQQRLELIFKRTCKAEVFLPKSGLGRCFWLMDGTGVVLGGLNLFYFIPTNVDVRVQNWSRFSFNCAEVMQWYIHVHIFYLC